jgi:hypothetical protein
MNLPVITCVKSCIPRVRSMGQSTTRYMSVFSDDIHSHSSTNISLGPFFCFCDDAQTIVKMDEAVMAVHNKILFPDYEFKLFDINGSCITSHGVYYLTDNGCISMFFRAFRSFLHFHPTFVLIRKLRFTRFASAGIPSTNACKHLCSMQPTRVRSCIQKCWRVCARMWNAHLASWYAAFNHVEFTLNCDSPAFVVRVTGHQKSRWRILKTGIRVHKRETVDNIWRTCCALHNLLLQVDGLDTDWDADGQFDADEVPVVFRRMNAELLNGGHTDLSSMRTKRIVVDDRHSQSELATHGQLRQALIANFAHRMTLPAGNPQEIKWPRRNGGSRKYMNLQTLKPYDWRDIEI